MFPTELHSAFLLAHVLDFCQLFASTKALCWTLTVAPSVSLEEWPQTLKASQMTSVKETSGPWAIGFIPCLAALDIVRGSEFKHLD